MSMNSEKAKKGRRKFAGLTLYYHLSTCTTPRFLGVTARNRSANPEVIDDSGFFLFYLGQYDFWSTKKQDLLISSSNLSL